MKAISKTGKVFSERFAKTAVKIGIGKEIPEVEEIEEAEKPKRVRKSKK